MQQLTTMDNAFVQQESTYTPMHISPVIIYDQSQLERGPVRFKEVLTLFERNLHKSAIFRRKLTGGAMGFDNPYWVEDPDFDLEFHVRHIALPKPGDWRQFCILLARLHARGLDMKRPLWEAYVIEGLNNIKDLPPNSFALMLKVHHAAIDGVSAAEIMTAIHSTTTEVEPPLVTDDWHGESKPSMGQVWARAYINNLKRPVKLVETAAELIPALIKARRDKKTPDEDKPQGFRTRFNAKVSAFRVTDTVRFELAEVKKIKNAVAGATINDVMVTVVGGAMRKYLLDKDELPETSLTCAAPINVRRERNSDSIGNEVSIMTIGMGTDIEDPVERLQAVNNNAQESKAQSSALGEGLMQDISRSLSPQFLGMGMRAITAAALRTDIPMPMHTVISNVPGPQMPLYFAGARMHTLLGMGPVLDMMGLFHAVISGAGGISINFTSCREMLPDPDFYRQCLQEAYDELKAAVAH